MTSSLQTGVEDIAYMLRYRAGTRRACIIQLQRERRAYLTQLWNAPAQLHRLGRRRADVKSVLEVLILNAYGFIGMFRSFQR